MIRKICCFITVAVLLLTVFQIGVHAQQDGAVSGELRLMSYNVDGLPIPEFLSSTGRDPRTATEKMAGYINGYSPDILAVQEDFNYHSVLKKSIELDYSTYTSGVVPFGDGLNFYAKLPLFNVGRIAWEESYGVFDAGSDELTPKGILYASFRTDEGIYIDFYNIHADGYEDDGSVAARISQYRQLVALINEKSAGRPVIIIGDTNSRLCRENQQLRKVFIEDEGFLDAWTEVCYEGNYPVWQSEGEAYSAGEEFGGPGWWGVYDSVDRVLYRSGGGVTLTATAHEYEYFYDNGVTLSDHAATKVTLAYSADRVPADTREYKTERFNPVRILLSGVKYFFKALWLIMSQIPLLIDGRIKVVIK